MLPAHVRLPDPPEPSPAPCPACASPAPRVIYGLRGIPVHSCVLLADAEAARAFPAGDLALAHCPACGFLFNAAFDPARLDYGEDYEETQGCSGTFRRWLDGVVRRWTDERGLVGKTVVEIGCGRGDFLEALCRAGRNRGVGIDPSATAGRVDRSAGLGLSFVRAVYGPEHAALRADLVACRHTLEHVGPVRELLEVLRANIDGSAARVFFEVPDVRRQLAEGAFWDFYYEHASYFSCGSLARLFRSVGLDVHELELAYDGQYVQLVGAPAAPGSAPRLPQEDDLDAVASAVEGFRLACRRSISRWHALLDTARERGEPVALWGSGSKATAFLTTLGAGEEVACVVDINPAKHGRFVAGSGHPIVAPADLRRLGPRHVIAMNPIYLEEIGRDLRALGVDAELTAV